MRISYCVFHVSLNHGTQPTVGRNEIRSTKHATRTDQGSATQYAIFLDRDGTINREVEYLARPEQLELLPGAAGGMRRLRAAGYRLVVVTNQAGVARGYFHEEDVRAVHVRLREMLQAEGVELDAVYYCPHHPEGQGAYRRACPNRMVTGKVAAVAVAVTPTSVTDPANSSSGQAAKRTVAASPRLIWAMKLPGTAIFTSGCVPDVKVATGWPALTFSFSSTVTAAMAPDVGASKRV